jgi:hypothetical protein
MNGVQHMGKMSCAPMPSEVPCFYKIWIIDFRSNYKKSYEVEGARCKGPMCSYVFIKSEPSVSDPLY